MLRALVYVCFSDLQLQQVQVASCVSSSNFAIITSYNHINAAELNMNICCDESAYVIDPNAEYQLHFEQFIKINDKTTGNVKTRFCILDHNRK